ncbi:MAG: nucleotidyltransferase family protein [Bryobacteraceae bacterium]|nr:nucleotidyltransferase family protein [Bryobacteraceae bacterium]
MPDVALDELKRVCERFGVASLSVFGSVARGEARPNSDIDLLVEFAPGRHPRLAYMDLQDELQRIFGRKVDLATQRWLNPGVKERVLSEARALYAA